MMSGKLIKRVGRWSRSDRWPSQKRTEGRGWKRTNGKNDGCSFLLRAWEGLGERLWRMEKVLIKKGVVGRKKLKQTCFLILLLIIILIIRAG